MHPSDSIFLDTLQADSIHFVIPVYQRMYSQDRENCEQLWKDIIAVGESEGGRHFTGSIVWVQDGAISGMGEITALLIDGQQRMTTLSLLLIALADYGKVHNGIGPDGSPLEFKWKRILNNYLLHDEDLEPGSENRYKLTLSDEDNLTFHSLIDELEDDSIEKARSSEKLIENYELLKSMLEVFTDPNIIWRGIRKLQIISVSLEQGVDNPQAIFESMNSTGKDLSAADLVRNYVLMGLPVKDQTRLYKNYWRPIECYIGSDNRDERFDEFLKDYLTVICAPEPINYKNIYSTFKRIVVKNNWRSVDEIEDLLAEIKRYASYYNRITLEGESDKQLKSLFLNLRRLNITVVNPLLMEFCDAFDSPRNRILKSDFEDLLSLVESYLVRRAVCDCATNSLNRFFPSIISKMRNLSTDYDYCKSFIALLALEKNTARRFPGDNEFNHAMITRNMYGFRKVLYLLNRLENSFHNKNNPIDFSTGQYSIEHIMPQNALAHDEWIQMLGGDDIAEEVYGELLHTLGNLTVTAYNSELSDGAFVEKKKRMEGGFDHDIISLSEDCKNIEIWNKDTILARANRLSNQALKVWPYVVADIDLIETFSKKPKRFVAIGEKVDIKTLFDEGYISAGTKLIHRGESGSSFAFITDEGKIQLSNGITFNSPSMAAIRDISLKTGIQRSQNGWSYWRIDNVSNELLDDVRKRYRIDKGYAIGEDDWNSWHIAFWDGFYEVASDSPEFCEAFADLSTRKPNRGYYCDLPSSIAGRHISLQVLTNKKKLGVRCGEWFTDIAEYRDFYNRKNDIEALFKDDSVNWFWDDPSATKNSRMPYVHKYFDINDEAERMNAYFWFMESAFKFKRFFS